MPRRLLINEQPSFASIGYSHQQLSRVPCGTVNRHSQFHCPKLKISKVLFALEEDKQYNSFHEKEPSRRRGPGIDRVFLETFPHKINFNF